MKINKILFLLLLVFSVSLIAPRSLKAIESSGVAVADTSFFGRIRERIEYFFAFSAQSKVEVLEKQAEKRLNEAQGNAESGNDQKASSKLQNYLQTKEKQTTVLKNMNDSDKVMEKVQERTIEQQKTMETIKTVTSHSVKQEVVQVQEQVVNQVAKEVVETNGAEGKNEFFEKVEHVWAPGTGPGGSAGVVIVGGSMKFAPGTEGGGESGVVIEGGSAKFAPGTSGGGNSGADIKHVEIKGN